MLSICATFWALSRSGDNLLPWNRAIPYVNVDYFKAGKKVLQIFPDEQQLIKEYDLALNGRYLFVSSDDEKPMPENQIRIYEHLKEGYKLIKVVEAPSSYSIDIDCVTAVETACFTINIPGKDKMEAALAMRAALTPFKCHNSVFMSFHEWEDLSVKLFDHLGMEFLPVIEQLLTRFEMVKSNVDIVEFSKPPLGST